MGKTGDRDTNFASMALSVLMGGGVFLAVTMALLLLCAAMISGGILDQTMRLQPVIGACVLGGFAGGVLTGCRWGCRRLLAGLAAAGTGFLLLMFIRLLAFDILDIGGSAPGVLAGCLCGGALAGLLSGGKKKKKKRR